MKRKELIYQLLIVLIGGLLFIPLNGRLNLFDWDELNFAESAREMILTNDYLNVKIYFTSFWEKPPLYIWLQVVSMKIFGINEFAARFPNAMCGIITLLVLYQIGRKLYDSRFGLIWVMTYLGSLLSFLYFKSGIIDPWFNLFIFLGIYFWVFASHSETVKKEIFLASLSAASIGLGILTKGPVAFLIFVIIAGILFVLNGFRLRIHWKSSIVFIVVVACIGGLWFILQIISGNTDVVVDFIVYQIRLFKTEDAGHGGFPMYHIVILLFGMFPASIFAIQGHKYKGKKDNRKTFHITMIALLWTVILLFSIVKTKIVHYSSLAYFPLTYLAAYSVFMIMSGRFHFQLWQKIMLLSIGGIEAIVIIVLPMFNSFKRIIIDKGIITDQFAVGNLQVDPGWTTLHSFIGILFFFGMLISIFFIKKNKSLKYSMLYLSSLLFVFLGVVFITPGIEKISQRTAINFIKETSKKDVYIHSFNKTYAVLFYSKVPVPENDRVFSQEWLTTGDIDKDAYFILRIHDKEKILSMYTELSVIDEKNGYVFCKRTAKLNPDD